MAFINDKTKEVNLKVVYYGPPLCGKSTSLRYIYERVKENNRGELASLSTGHDRTLYFDFVPISLGKHKNYDIRLHLYTVPGEVAYQAARKIISKGVDGAVFLADSQLEKLEANLQSMMQFKEMVEESGEEFERLPVVFQYNKRDLPGAVKTDELRKLLNPRGLPDFETVAVKGQGVYEAFKAISKGVLKTLQGQ
ncbi:MAG: gliding-motility protein MglA [Deltaproteobacteria bacterium]|nr:gliding-motility protein MglA [Deltaproteobacteria bacterium]